MKRPMPLFLILGGILILSFQNCGGVKFSESKNESLVAKVEDPSTVTKQDESVGDGSQVEVVPPVEEVVDPVACDHGKKPGKGGEQDPVVSDDDDNNARIYVCVLEGAGKSIKVGLIDEKLAGKLATPQDVCMSKVACEEIVSQHFQVREAAKRGFCPNKNPNVVELSDEKIQSLINELNK